MYELTIGTEDYNIDEIISGSYTTYLKNKEALTSLSCYDQLLNLNNEDFHKFNNIIKNIK